MLLSGMLLSIKAGDLLIMSSCPHCHSEFEGEACTVCGTSREHHFSDNPPSQEDEHFTVPFSISVADAHVLLFSWLEKGYGANFQRDHFHIHRMNRHYYCCWLFWFSIPVSDTDKSEDPSASGAAAESGKRTKIMMIPGNEQIPPEVLSFASQYDFMELTLLEQKITSSPEFTAVNRSEKDSFAEALRKLQDEEPELFDTDNKLLPAVTLLHRVPLAMPVWEGAYDYLGGKERTFYINGQKGQIEGMGYVKDEKGIDVRRYLPYFVCAVGVLIVIIILSWALSNLAKNELPEPSGSIVSSPAYSASESLPAEINSPEPAVTSDSSITPEASAAPEASITPEASASPVASAVPSPSNESSPPMENADSKLVIAAVNDNFKAIQSRDFKKVHALRTEAIQKEKKVADYEKLYSDNLSITVLESSVVSVSVNKARVAVSLLSRDMINGKREEGKYTGWFQLIKEHGTWKIEDSNLTVIPGTLEEVK